MYIVTSTTIVGSRDGPHLLITGGVHGDEFEGPVAAHRLVRRIQPERLCGRLTLAPVVNEPAMRRRSRCGEDGKDLARTCPGRQDGTITEQVAIALTQLICTADYYIDLHSGGVALDVFPLVGYMLHPDPAILEAQRRLAHAFNMRFVWGTSARLDGRSMSAARDCGVPAIYAEYRGSGLCREEGVEAYVDGCLNVMAALNMIEREQPPSCIRYVVEDDRPDSGHMQIQNPSPGTGIFEPAVRPGDFVQEGETLGTIMGLHSETTLRVPASTAGLAAVVRSYPYVDSGDSLAVVVELADHTGDAA